MTEWKAAAAAGLLFFGLGGGAGATENSYRQWRWVYQEMVAPEKVADYERAIREFLGTLRTSLPLEISVVASSGGVYTLLSTVRSGDGPGSEAGPSVVERIIREKAKSLAARGILEPSNTPGSLFVQAPELSYSARGSPPSPSDEPGFVRYTFHELTRDREETALHAVRRLVALYEDRGVAADLQVFRLTGHPERRALVTAAAAATREALLAQQQEIERRLGARGQALRRKLQASAQRIEVVEGALRPDLSYPASADLAVPLEPFPAEPSPPPVSVETLEPLPPELPAPPEPIRASAAPDFTVVEDTIYAWAAAWAGQRVDGYFGFYSSAFDPGGGSRQGWERRRREQITAPAIIEIDIEGLSVRIDRPRTVWVEFTQTYRSDTFSDVVRKRMELGWEDGGWKIVREEILAAQ